jgi:Flp pilus assembly protein TadG
MILRSVPTSRRMRERGQVLPLVAIALAVLVGFAGMAVDVGYYEYQERQMQNAADGAAVDGAQQLIYSGCPNSSAAQTAALNGAASNGYTSGVNGILVTVNNPPTSGPYAGNNCAVSVEVNNPYSASFFTKLFGYSKGMSETTSAVATIAANNNACIYLLSPTIASAFSGVTINAPKCGILFNDTFSSSGSTIDAAQIGYAGSAPSAAGTTYGDASPAPMLPVADPCAEIAGCEYLTTDPPPTDCTQTYSNAGATVTIGPGGCYSNFSCSGCNLTFQSGTYVFTGSLSLSGSNVSGTGVTLYLANNATPAFAGANLNLSPPSTGNYANVLYYQVPSNTNGPAFSGTNDQLSGLIYAPGAINAAFSGSSGGYAVVVFGSISQSGTTDSAVGGAPTNGSLIKKAVLVQ